MASKRLIVFLFLLVVLKAYADDTLTLFSHNHNIQLTVYRQSDGQLKYGVYYKQKFFIKPSALAMKLSTPDVLLNKFDIVRADQKQLDETWKPVWGEVSTIRNNYQELALQLKDRSGSGILMNIVFRVFDDGVGFRYEFPTQQKLNHFVVADEMTQFCMGAIIKLFGSPVILIQTNSNIITQS